MADTVRHMTHFAVLKDGAPGLVEGGSLRNNGLPVGFERGSGKMVGSWRSV